MAEGKSSEFVDLEIKTCSEHFPVTEDEKAQDRLDEADAVIGRDEDLDFTDIDYLQEVPEEKLEEPSPVKRLVGMVVKEAVRHRANNIYFMPTEDDFRMAYDVDGAMLEMLPPPKSIAVVIGEELERGFGKLEEQTQKKGWFKKQKEPIITKRMIEGEVARKYLSEVSEAVTGTLTKLNTASGAQYRVKLFYHQFGFPDFDEDDQKSIGKIMDGLKKDGGLVIVSSRPDDGRTSAAHGLIDLLNPSDKRILVVGGEPIHGLPYIEKDNRHAIVQFNPHVVYFDNIIPNTYHAVSLARNGKTVIGSVVAPSFERLLVHMEKNGIDRKLVDECLRGRVNVTLERQKHDCDGGCEECRGTEYFGRKAVYKFEYGL